jgi:hypothetical protein
LFCTNQFYSLPSIFSFQHFILPTCFSTQIEFRPITRNAKCVKSIIEQIHEEANWAGQAGTRQERVEQGRLGHGRRGNGRTGWDTAGEGMKEQAGRRQEREWKNRLGQGRRGNGRTGWDTAGEGMEEQAGTRQECE